MPASLPVSARVRRRLREALAAGLGERPDTDVAVSLGVGRSAVGRYRQILSIPLSVEARREAVRLHVANRRPDHMRVETIRSLAGRGFTLNAISLRLRCGVKTILRIAREHGLGVASIGRGEGAAPGGGGSAARGPHMRAAPRAAWRDYKSDRYGALARRIRPLAARGNSLNAIAIALREARPTVLAAARRARIRIAPAFRDWERERIDWGKPNIDIARRLGVSVGRIWKARRDLRRRGLPVPPCPDCARAVAAALRRRAEARIAPLVPRVRRLAREGLGTVAMARRLRVGPWTIRFVCERFRIRVRRRFPILRASPEARLRMARRSGLGRRPDSEVARALGVGTTTVGRWRKGLGIPLSEAARAAIHAHRRAGKAVSDAALARRVRPLAARGLTAAAIALRCRCGQNRAVRVARRFHIALRVAWP